MTSHADVIASFRGALRGGPLPAGLSARDASELDRRMAVYRNNVAASLTAALAARFPVIRQLVGEEFFAAMAPIFVAEDGPGSPVLAEWGAGFARFLDDFWPLRAWPWMGDVARIEFARGQAFHAADATPVDPARLAAADPATVRLRLHPSVRLMRLSHPAVSVWRRHQPDGADLPPGAGPETALILRDRAYGVPVRAIADGDAALLEALGKGWPLADAAEAARQADPAHDPQPLLVALMREGAIVDATE
jgi:hypothetical protein